MAKRAILAATAILVGNFNPILIAPAMANPTPIADTTGLSPQDVCELQLKPNDPNSEFQTEPVGEVVGDWVTTDTQVTDPIGDAYGVGTPTFSNVIIANSFFRNGGSPNVWALATATVSFPQTGQLFDTEITQERTITFDCHVFKFVPNGNMVEPAGLQSTGNSTVEEQTISGDPQIVITDDDFIIEGQTVHALVCISPNNVTKGKPGTWTGKNGFPASGCPAASAAAGGTVPSGNAPNI